MSQKRNLSVKISNRDREDSMQMIAGINMKKEVEMKKLTARFFRMLNTTINHQK